jgi:sulfate transporter 3
LFHLKLASIVSSITVPLQEGIAVGRTFASLKDYQIDGNKEMMAIGLMNVVGSCTSCYVTTGTVH